jgi:hypothetical protein
MVTVSSGRGAATPLANDHDSVKFSPLTKTEKKKKKKKKKKKNQHYKKIQQKKKSLTKKLKVAVP